MFEEKNELVLDAEAVNEQELEGDGYDEDADELRPCMDCKQRNVELEEGVEEDETFNNFDNLYEQDLLHIYCSLDGRRINDESENPDWCPYRQHVRDGDRR